MIKVDVYGQETQVASVSLCLLREFFEQQMGIHPDELPEPLRGLLRSGHDGYAFHRFALPPELLEAARSILTAPAAVRSESLYMEAKAVELMCLLINHIKSCSARGVGTATDSRGRRESRLHQARDLLTRHYAESMTLDRIAREVGLNKMALTSGFRELFGVSVHGCLQKLRMERAYALLQEQDRSIRQVAEAVGYRHPCNFSTAFHAHFGCTPQAARAISGRLARRSPERSELDDPQPGEG
jgi:AraC-like DNA-binding protein